MIGVGAKVEGLAGLNAALAEVGSKATQKNVLRRSLTKSAEPFLLTWKGLAPRRTGRYEQSLHIGTKLTRSQRGTAYKPEGTLGFVEIHVGTNDPAGQQQEFGNVNHPAQPSGRPAWESKKQSVLLSFGGFMWDDLRKTAERAARKSARA